MVRTFIVRARTAKTTPDFSVDDLPGSGRMDLVCRCISSALFISLDVRRDTIIHVVLEGPKEPPKTITFYGDKIKDLQPDERFLALIIKKAVSAKLEGKEVEVILGVFVSKKSFEAVVKELAKTQLIYLDPDGKDIRKFEFKKDFTAVLSDYIGMPRKSEGWLERMNAEKISLGPVTLFASHAIVVMHNEIDRKLN